MTYLDYINLFWQQDYAENFTTTETRLYFLLLKLANRNRWQGEVVIGDRQALGNGRRFARIVQGGKGDVAQQRAYRV